LNEIIKNARKELHRLEKLRVKIQGFLDNAPEGCLKWQRKNGKVYYYQQFVKNLEKKRHNEMLFNEKGVNKWGRKYIRKDEFLVAEKLAQKQYYLSISPIIEKQIALLKKLIDTYPDNKMESIYDELSIERKNLVIPVCISAKEQVKRWKAEVYEKTVMYPENLKYETEQGELVRSKSEVIIANILYHNSENILYKYERPLELKINGKEKIFYPDFTIINKHTGKITYWEHAGRMDDPYYAGDFVRKMNVYVENDLLPGRDIFLTFETLSNQLDINAVNKLIKSLF